MRIRFVFVLFLLLFSFIVNGADSFEEWKQRRNQEFGQYKSEADAQFSKFLKQRWKDYNLYRGNKVYEEKKPTQLPEAKPQPKKPVETTPPVKVEPPQEIPPEVPTALPPILPKPLEPDSEKAETPPPQQEFRISYFNRELVLQIPSSIAKFRISNAPREKQISGAWEKVAQSNYESMVDQYKSAKTNLKLNDWGYGNFVQTANEQIYKNSPDTARFMTWFIMLKSGYDIRLAYSRTRLFILVKTKEEVFNTPYLNIQNKRYYNTGFSGINPPKSRLKSYPRSYPESNRALEIKFLEYPLLGKSREVKKELSFRYNRKEYRLPVRYDRNYIRFINAFPSSSFDVFLASPMNPQAGNVLLNFMRKNIQGKSQLEAVNFILSFVQNAFKYETDQEQFGFEKYFYPDELLFYEYSDCEDRVALFSYLVRSLLKADIIALQFPNHLAAAIHFDGKVEGVSYSYRGKKYVITDPTYINASAGQIMPIYKKAKPKLISF